MKRFFLVSVLSLSAGIAGATFEIKDPAQPDEKTTQLQAVEESENDANTGAPTAQVEGLQQAVEDFNNGIANLAKGNNDKGFILLQMSALAGHVPAAYYLAELYFDGLGTTQNFAEAYIWASVAAAESGNSNADKAAEKRDAYAKFLSMDALNAAQQRAAILLAETRAKRGAVE